MFVFFFTLFLCIAYRRKSKFPSGIIKSTLSSLGGKKLPFLQTDIRLTSCSFPHQAVKGFMTLECKCHGVSGSCSIRTCWLAMADFRRTSDHLRKKYNGAVQVAVNQYGTGFTAAHTRFKRPSKNDLVYSEDSPDYCIRDYESGEHPLRTSQLSWSTLELSSVSFEFPLFMCHCKEP